MNPPPFAARIASKTHDLRDRVGVGGILGHTTDVSVSDLTPHDRGGTA